MSNAAPSNVAARLLAHARLCRHMASQTWSEEVASELEQLAAECSRAAAEVANESGEHIDR